MFKCVSTAVNLEDKEETFMWVWLFKASLCFYCVLDVVFLWLSDEFPMPVRSLRRIITASHSCLTGF